MGVPFKQGRVIRVVESLIEWISVMRVVIICEDLAWELVCYGEHTRDKLGSSVPYLLLILYLEPLRALKALGSNLAQV